MPTGLYHSGRRAQTPRSPGACEARAAVPALADALRDEDTCLCVFAAYALGEIGPEARAAVPALISWYNQALANKLPLQGQSLRSPSLRN